VTSRPTGWKFVCCFCLGSLSFAVAGQPAPRAGARPLPAIALIIDDLGYQRTRGHTAVTLPGPVACAFLPHGPFTRELARQAHAGHKEVMLHLPMQALETDKRKPEPGVLTLDMTRTQFRTTFEEDIAAVPYVSGLNNHMGSLLTQHPGDMAWLMQEISEHGRLFFVDSRTTSATVARQLAQEYGIPNSERNVFLDNDQDPAAVRGKLRELVAMARRYGTALGIGHPHPATLEVLVDVLHTLGDQGVRLIPVARLIELQGDRHLVWQTSSSR